MNTISHLRSEKILRWLMILYCIIASTSHAQSLQRYTVIGQSMQPTIHPGDVVIVSDACITNNVIHKQDIVAITFNGTKTPLIKRILATPGSTVDNKQYSPQSILGRQLRAYHYTLPDQHYIVGGDNSSSSIDSQHFGLISITQIKGCLKEIIRKSLKHNTDQSD